MANRQHGSRPSGGRNGRAARAVPVSRSPAGGRENWTPFPPGTPIYKEPEVRRWPHPPEETSSAQTPEPALHYIRCALSYQNQLLADIKALLERLAEEAPVAAAAPLPVERTAEPGEAAQSQAKM